MTLPLPPDAPLDDARRRADPLADATIAALLAGTDAPGREAERLQRVGLVNRQLAQWGHNDDIAPWRPADPATPDDIVEPLQAYLKAGRMLPDWADPARIARAEALFIDEGVLSCTLLFCASLPECYVIPDLAAVLQIAGQLEAHTEHRIRVTAAMIFPVMMQGGLTRPDGGGVAQILKVRLIHATIRHLILRGSPEAAIAAGAAIPPLTPGATAAGLQQALLDHGWDLPADGLPCNQEELAYTLLTFGYVFLRGMRTLGLRLSRADEEALLHTWNVAGHVLGIERALMADTMDQAEALFATIQARGRTRTVRPDPRPALGEALMRAMETAIAVPVLRRFPVLLTRRLCGAKVARELGIDGRQPWLVRALFWLAMGLVRGVDAVGRLFRPGFSLARCLTRVLGYHLMTRLLLDQTRPLQLPDELLGQMQPLITSWSDDRRAPRWLNALEDRLTTRGPWLSSLRRARP